MSDYLGPEMGYNYLNTCFTGTSSAQLTGAAMFLNPFGDCGVARLQQDFEIR